MRFMVMVKATAAAEAGVMPSGEFIEQMGAYNNELIAAGVMLDGAGLLSSSNGARVSFDGDHPALGSDGPGEGRKVRTITGADVDNHVSLPGLV